MAYLKILIYSFLTAIGVIVLHHARLVTGGTGGLSLSVTYLTGVPFYAVFFVMNLPFYLISFKGIGPTFTLRTVLAVTWMSLSTGIDSLLPSIPIPPILGAPIAGTLIGLGVSGVFLNQSSLGGFNILAMYCLKRFGWKPGTVNFFFDFLAVASGFYSVGAWHGILSVLSIFITARIINYNKNKIARGNSFSTVTEDSKQG